MIDTLADLVGLLFGALLIYVVLRSINDRAGIGRLERRLAALEGREAHGWNELRRHVDAVRGH